MGFSRQKTVGVLCVVASVSAFAAAIPDQHPLDLGASAKEDLRSAFAGVATGDQQIDGVTFHIGEQRVRVTPGKAERLALNSAKCAAVHVLHYTEHSGERIGSYVLVYEDGERMEVPIFSGLSIQDWWMPGSLPFASVAHNDKLKHGDQVQPIGFWRFSFVNPKPDAPLDAIEIVNSQDPAVVNVVAITLSGDCGKEIGGVPLWLPGMAEEPRWTAVLRHEGSGSGKAQACERLRISGTVESVPALAACLGDEVLSHAARMALEAMPYPEALDALRGALDTTEGEARRGIVVSLGARRDRESVPLLVPLLQDDDSGMVASAAMALGKIGGSAAIEALTALRANCADSLRPVVIDALLRATERLCAEDPAAAHGVYAALFDSPAPDHIRTAAYRGMIQTAGDEAVALVESALTGGGPELVAAALPAVREMTARGATQAFAALLDRVSGPVLIGLIESLAQRGDAAAAPAVAEFTSDTDAAVRAAAIRSLALIGNGKVIPVLVKTAARGEKSDRKAAEDVLSQLGTPDVLDALLSLADSVDAAQQTVVARALGQRRGEAVRQALLQLARTDDAGVRSEAVLALGDVGTAADVAEICDLAAASKGQQDREAVTRALTVLGARLGTPDAFVDTVLSNLAKDNVGLRCAMLPVCGGLGHPRFLEALGRAAGDANAEVQDAALRALSGSRAPGALVYLLPLIDTASTSTHRVLVLRGIAKLASNVDGLKASVREDALRRALAAAERAEEKRLLLSALGQCHTVGALKCAQAHVSTPDVAAEAAMAWGQIAKALAGSDAELVRTSSEAVLASAREAGVSQTVQQEILDLLRAAGATAVPGSQVRFEKVVVDKQFRSEGVAVADVDGDGAKDILAGDVWYAAPDWKVNEIRSPKTYDAQNGYSECFANFSADVDEDGRPDSIVVGFPAAPAFWYRNPGDAGKHWEAHQFAPAACGETPIYGDLLGDGRPVPVFALDSRITWFQPGSDVTADWKAYPVTDQVPGFDRFGHGTGMGDVNGDGRIDLLSTIGWWEAPRDRTRSDWPFHKVDLGPACADMVVYDVDGDGDNDILTSSAHEYGVWWFEHKREGNEIAFERHEIYSGVSQTHALILADINNDGLSDLVTGKRYRAHNGHDTGGNEAAVLFWLELERPEQGGCTFKLHHIDLDSGVGTQFRVCDLDGDGLLDIITSNKKGVHAFLQRRDG